MINIYVHVVKGFCFVYQMVMANVQTLLENADTPDLLNSVVNVILHIAKNYPNVFTSHFRVSIYILHISTCDLCDLLTVNLASKYNNNLKDFLNFSVDV